ncbi:AbiH family protein [Lactobacillus sp. PV034]|uniref:AbiH family protein n=1 Tax=Lactobacillus sp. PV034 TaxID=2594495 RepID=UPI00223F3139|nr:AbiH family protein [Lactobacillus sp. PV034]QNQ80208.1 hypothetical protein FP432_00880 [Lactobacillus sp. PV034]
MKENTDVEWNSIEEIIYEVIRVVFEENKELNLEFQNEEDREWISQLIRYIFSESRGLENSVIKDLEQFEENFGKYISNELNNKYYSNVAVLINKLVKDNIDKEISLDVLNFNYSINQQDAEAIIKRINRVSLNSWRNIHGTARYFGEEMKPIFGIDMHDILENENASYSGELSEQNYNFNKLPFNDSKVIFTKFFRLLFGNKDNSNIALNKFSSNIDKIIFYGHSLSHADYSYFESIFDMYDIYNIHSKVELDFYYHHVHNPQNSKKLNTENINSRRSSVKNIVNLLTSYGQTLGKENHGENIVNRLILEQRLHVLESPK